MDRDLVKTDRGDVVRTTRFPLPRTAKAKLLVAFSLIVGLTMMVGWIGLRGFSDTEQALSSLRGQSLPDISKAMELAKRSSAVAAIAPFVGSIQVMSKLNVESARLEEQLESLRALVDAVEPARDPQAKPDSGSLKDLSNRLEADLKVLISNTREELGIRSDMLELRYALERRDAVQAAIGHNDNGLDGVSGNAASFQGLVETVLTAISSEDPMMVNKLQAEFGRFSEGLKLGSNIPADRPDLIELRQFIASQAEVFDLRLRQIGSFQKKQYLLASIHALSTQLADRVSEVAARTSQIAQARSSQTDAALGRGKERIVYLTLIAVLVGATAAYYVLRHLAGNLQAVTIAMTRLASGDRTTSVPAMDRTDELGSLARAFDIFKKQSFDREALASDLVAKSRTLEATFASMTDGMSVFDATGHLVAWNQQFLEINELDPASIRPGMHFHELLDQLASAGVVATFLDGGIANPEELFRRRQTEAIRYEQTFGSGRLVELRSQPMQGGFATIYTDLTERRTVERQLRQAQRMEAVGQLTSGVAHDFNNLLAAVSGNLEMLHETLHDRPDLTSRILRALEAAERGATLTQRLLAFSRQQALQPESTDLNCLILNLLNLLDYSLGNNISLEADLEPGLAHVFVDPGQLENAILNLIFNGRDAMAQGGKISIKTSSVAPNGLDIRDGSVRVSVKDQGTGMSPDILGRVYEPFFTTKDRGRGSGLGLSMVYGFISQSGGQVDIESKPGMGTIVSLMLPKARAGTIILPPEPSLETQGTSAGGNESILIVEDDPIVRATALDTLTGLGYRAVAAGSVEQAKFELHRSTFDLLFTDYILPAGTTGDDVAAYARKTQPGIAVLYTSGYQRDKSAQDMRSVTEVSLIGKPYRKGQLAKTIRQLLDAHQSNPKRSTA